MRGILIPIGGVGNRLRVISSAVNLGFKNIVLINIRSESLNAQAPDYIDLESAGIIVKVIDVYMGRDIFARRFFGLVANLVAMFSFKKFASFYNSRDFQASHKLVVTCHEFKTGSIKPGDVMALDKDHFSQFCSNLSSTLPKQYWSMHIRHGDNKRAKALLHLKSFEDFVKSSPYKVFLATDSEEMKNQFVKKFGPKVIVSCKCADRESTNGIKDAISELHILKNAHKFKPTAQSSFSKTVLSLRTNNKEESWEKLK
jgi:hypothetical protein